MIDRQGRNATWNKGVGRMLGYSMAEFLGHPVAECYTPEDQAADLPAQQMAEAIEHGRTTRERWVVRKDGSRFWLRLRRPLHGTPKAR
jgi:PAS domain S-box-containing protein